MTNVLLINPPWGKPKGSIWSKVSSCLPSLGLGYIAATLELNGIRVEILDCQAISYAQDEILSKIKDFQPAYIGFTATTVLIQNVFEIAKSIKLHWPETKIILGGVHPTIATEEVLTKPYVDIVVRGEGENTFLDIVKNKPLKDVLGISYKLNGSIKHNLDRPLIEDIDSLPFPAYHLMPMDRYHTALGSAKRTPAMSIFATRGCPGRCTFCYSGAFGKKIRKRSPENIIGEIELLMSKHKIREISFYDDTFSAYKKNVLRFCELIREKNIDLTWTCMSRVDYVTEDVLKEMKASGCHQICYGVETVDENILKNIRKRLSLEKVKRAVENTKKAKMDVRLAFMLGNPGETIESMEKSIEYAINLDPDLVQFNITTPYPGTEMFLWAKEHGYLKTEDWSKYDYYTCVMELPTVSSADIEKYYKIAYRRFFLRPTYLMKRLLKLRNFYDIKIAYKSLVSVFLTAIGR